MCNGLYYRNASRMYDGARISTIFTIPTRPRLIPLVHELTAGAFARTRSRGLAYAFSKMLSLLGSSSKTHHGNASFSLFVIRSGYSFQCEREKNTDHTVSNGK